MKLDLGKLRLVSNQQGHHQFLVLVFGDNLVFGDQNVIQRIHHKHVDAEEGDSQFAT